MDENMKNVSNGAAIVDQIKNEPLAEENTISTINERPLDQKLDEAVLLRRKKSIQHEIIQKKRRKKFVVHDSSSSDEEEYLLTVSNLPSDWTYVQIKNYIDRECGPVDEIEMLKQGQNCAITLTFQTSENCKNAMKRLQDKEVEGRKLQMQITENMDAEGIIDNDDQVKSDIINASGSDTTEIISPMSPPVLDDDTWDASPKDLYGLKPQFLKSLGIRPPLEKWVHVTNFRCDKSELRDVLELAGHVVMCSVIAVSHKYAKVMYSHPLEAVQAISMLNGKMFYGQALKLTMDRNPSNTVILPKGLPDIGLGLGIYGRPLRNIVKQYKKFIRKHSSLINPILFEDSDAEIHVCNSAETAALNNKIKKEIDDLIETTKTNKRPFKIKNVEDLDNEDPKGNEKNLSPETFKTGTVGSKYPNLTASPKSHLWNAPQNTLRPIGPQNIAPGNVLPVRLSQPNTVQKFQQPFRNPVSNPQNLPRPNFSPFPPSHGQFSPQGPYGMPGPNIGQPGPAPFGPRPIIRPQGPMHNVGPVPEPVRPQGGTTVHFSNLPSSTTFPLLCEKVSQCGQVMSVQLTTPGCAIANFAHPSHAERCFLTFNRMNVEGYVIEVRIV